MDKASDFESEDCEFESLRGRLCIIFPLSYLYRQRSIVIYLFIEFLQNLSMISAHLSNRHNVLQVYISFLSLACSIG